MQRVSVVGTSGSGKTTTARRIAAALDVAYVELDALHWGPDWTQASAEELAERVVDATKPDAWVVDGNYQSKVGTLVWERADTVVWINPPRWRVMRQVIGRTLRRIVTRKELWSGNRESWGGLRFWRGEESVIWWAWTTYKVNEERYEVAMREGPYAELDWHRLRTRRDIERFVASLR